MKKQTVCLFFLVLLSLTACPSDETIQYAGPPYPQAQLPCCWEDLLKAHVNYPAMAGSAYSGEEAGLKALLKLSAELNLTASYAHGVVLAGVLQKVGDAHFAKVLETLAADFKKANSGLEETLQDTFRNLLEGGFVLNTDPAVKSHVLSDFPLTAGLLKYELQKAP